MKLESLGQGVEVGKTWGAVCVRERLNRWIFLVWLTLNFCLTQSWILNQCLPPWVTEVSDYLLHVLCSWTVQPTETGQGSVCVVKGGGGLVMTQLIIAPLAICGPIYTGKWEGVRKKKKKARQCGSTPGRYYITSRADEFVRCKTFCIKELGLRGYKWQHNSHWLTRFNKSIITAFCLFICMWLCTFLSGRIFFFPPLCSLSTKELNCDSAFCSGLHCERTFCIIWLFFKKLWNYGSVFKSKSEYFPCGI